MLRAIIVFVLVLAVTVVLGTIVQSYFVMDAWANAAGQAAGTGPVELSMSDRVAWVSHDIVGLAPMYGLLVGIAFVIAFVVAGLLARVTGLRTIVFMVAGAVAIVILFETMKVMLGTVGVFGARGTMGLAGQAAVGAIAGLLFATFKPAAE